MPASHTSDLRSEAKSYQRVKNHNTKWANGIVPRMGPRVPLYLQTTMINEAEGVKPAAAWEHNHGAARRKKLEKKSYNAQATTMARKTFRNELSAAFDGPLAGVVDTSSDEEVHDASAAPLPAEADFLYSYDLNSGPTAGRDILSAALNKAVQRFENTETDKLITREYDVIDQLEEGYSANDEEDYEMVEHAHLK